MAFVYYAWPPFDNTFDKSLCRSFICRWIFVKLTQWMQLGLMYLKVFFSHFYMEERRYRMRTNRTSCRRPSVDNCGHGLSQLQPHSVMSAAVMPNLPPTQSNADNA